LTLDALPECLDAVTTKEYFNNAFKTFDAGSITGMTFQRFGFSGERINRLSVRDSFYHSLFKDFRGVNNPKSD
jgi:hypothetical protein